MMYGFGDDQNPYTESVDLIEDLVIEFITDMTHRAMEIGRTGRVQVEDIVFLSNLSILYTYCNYVIIYISILNKCLKNNIYIYFINFFIICNNRFLYNLFLSIFCSEKRSQKICQSKRSFNNE
jgi:hypothetical protein